MQFFFSTGTKQHPSRYYFVIRQKPHPRFICQNDDLYYTAHISLEKVKKKKRFNKQNISYRLTRDIFLFLGWFSCWMFSIRPTWLKISSTTLIKYKWFWFSMILNIFVVTLQALTGFSVEVETLDGRLLNIPINDIVQWVNHFLSLTYIGEITDKSACLKLLIKTL